ncbi:MAG: hypothetical protein ACI379_17150 [Nocardioides sp.]|uniref:hypothetical protein n=1 Tax=Nocardioides sp. TaxID=35761 RepID=UPI003F086DCF
MSSPTDTSPASPSGTSATDGPTSWQHLGGLAVGLTLLVTLVLLAFSWPSTTAEPRDVPLAVAGAPAQVQAVAAALDKAQPGAFEVDQVADRDAAVVRIEEREAYGAIVLGAEPEILVSSAANASMAQLLGNLATPVQALLAQSTPPAEDGTPAAAPTVTVTDVVPLSADDPRGTGLTAAALPLVIGGMLGGVVTSLVVRGTSRRVVGLVAYTVLAGLAMTLVLSTWFGFLPGNFAAVWGVFTMTLLAISSTISGLASVIGRAGIAIGALTFLLLGNPLSGVALPKEFLPSPWGGIGQLLPPGAGSTLLRLVSYFPDASTTQPWLVLVVWSLLGLVLLLVGHRRTVVATVPA